MKILFLKSKALKNSVSRYKIIKDSLPQPAKFIQLHKNLIIQPIIKPIYLNAEIIFNPNLKSIQTLYLINLNQTSQPIIPNPLLQLQQNYKKSKNFISH